MSQFAARLKEAADRINVALDALLPREQGSESRLINAIRYAALDGGKRLRPFFTLEVGRMFDADEAALLRAAVAVECVHTYSLIHDDLPCMDDDDLRRGRPTLHRQYDEATALLAGDALLTFAFEVLADPASHSDPQMRCKLIAALARAAGAQGMVAGQAADMAGADTGSDLIGVTRMNRQKTGALINFSVDAGALIAIASEAEKTALSRYAHDIGLAFQMVDDLLDAEGVIRDTGKAVGKDKGRGKVNFVTVLGAEATRERIGMLAKQAKQHVAMFGPRASVLREAVDFVVERRY
ncbi:polyprenyl synthetase family protein [Terricaulis silvestris]|uniref:Farnesyl diphosphate synthase n=1 Tax=Terricaulis silvestris TaxID=2686094 RepID=A0A6I6MSX0_9CAUL|nr:farnesyl diphosphate synthase [Terricaulis silvestris]QGZ95674.1 Farnesyl diphosphate synthase [Terricaulis silvestris]